MPLSSNFEASEAPVGIRLTDSSSGKMMLLHIENTALVREEPQSIDIEMGGISVQD
jgi:hypothetical protein